MLTPGPAKKVTIHLGEDQKYHGHALYTAILDYLFHSSVAGASVFRGIAGFGAHHKMHTARILVLTENLPVKIEFIESQAKLDAVLPKLQEMVQSGLITISDVEVVKHANDDEAHSKV
jgi:PII-like signaling protein